MITAPSQENFTQGLSRKITLLTQTNVTPENNSVQTVIQEIICSYRNRSNMTHTTADTGNPKIHFAGVACSRPDVATALGDYPSDRRITDCLLPKMKRVAVTEWADSDFCDQ